MAGTTVEIKTQTGSGFTGYLAVPDAKKAPGILLIQEIFGVNSHIREVADLYAEAGYVVLAPDVFWRVQKNVELGYTGEDIQKGIELIGKCDKEQIVSDLKDAIATLKGNAQCDGKVAAVGYCLGGFVSYKLACANLVDAAVCYYGGMIEASLAEADKIKCPVMMHFGEKDEHIPLSSVEKIQQALAGKPDVEIFVYKGADHGFNCDQRASYDRHSAMLACGRSMRMLGKALS